MLKYLESCTYIICLVIGIIIGLVFFFITKSNHSKEGERCIHLDFILSPTRNTLSILSLLIPILATLTAYLILKNPKEEISFLLASITTMLAVLFIAIWISFSLISIASKESYVKLSLPDDGIFIAFLASMYSLLSVSIIYLILFFIFQFSPENYMK